jgi:hypothetical protein
MQGRSRAQKSSETRREVSSHDGVVRFLLERLATGVRVEREEVRPSGSRVTHSVLLANAFAFERFCSADPLRFEYPLIYQQIRREFHDLSSADA